MSETPDWIKQAASDIDVSAVHRGINVHKAIEAAMLSVAARVERETFEQCFEIANLDRRSELAKRYNHKPLAHRYALAIAAAIHAIPAKYQEPKP